MTDEGPILLCVGDIDIDIVIKVARPPGRDEKIDGVPVGRTAGGMAANVAVGARRLGLPVRMLGAVGDDAMGREALGLLRDEGLDLDHVVVRDGVATFFCVILVDETGEKSLVKAVSEAYLPRAEDLQRAAFEGVSHVHLTFTEPELAGRALELAKGCGASVSLDLEAADVPLDGGRVAELVDAVDVLFVSENSRRLIERRLGPLQADEGRTLVMTRGAAGARLERDGQCIDVAGNAVPVTDTSGAGDAFAAAFLASRLRGSTDDEALRFANAAAALSTRAYGAQAGLPRQAEVEDFLTIRAEERSDA